MQLIFRKALPEKVNRKKLFVSLICAEILGILVLVWFLRSPLSQKFFIAPSKTYSVISMDPKKQYLVRQGDFLTGKAIPETRVGVLLIPSNKKFYTDSNKNGSWYIQIPEDLDIKKYHFSLVNYDTNNNIAFLKTIKLRVTYNNRFSQLLSTLKNKLEYIHKKILPLAKAQSDDDLQIDFSENFGRWVQSIQSLGYYVYCEKDGVDSPCEDGADVFLTNYDGIVSYCNLLSKQCYLPQRPDRDLIADAQNSSEEFINKLVENVYSAGYNPRALLDYFPEIDNSKRFQQIVSSESIQYKEYDLYIEEDKLAEIIQKTINDFGWNQIWWDENFGDPVKSLISTTDPILGTKALLRYVEVGNFNKLTYEEQSNLILALAFLPIPAKGGKVLLNTTKNADELVSLGKLVRAELDSSSSFPLSQLRNLFSPEDLAAFHRAAEEGATRVLRTKLPTNLPILKGTPTFGLGQAARIFFTRAIYPYVQKGLVYSVDRDTADFVFKNLDQTIAQLERKFGRRFYIADDISRYEAEPYDQWGYDISSILNNGATIVIDDDSFARLGDSGMGAFTVDNLSVIPRRHWNNDQTGFLFYSHELVHQIKSHRRLDFAYNSSSARDKLCQAFYELGTDRIATYATLNRRGFSLDEIDDQKLNIFEAFSGGGYPHLHNNEHQLITSFKTKNSLTEFHIMNFAIHGQCDVFLSAMLDSGFNLIPEQNLVQQFIKAAKDNFNIDLSAVKIIVPTGVLTEYQSEVQIFPSVDFSDIFNTNLDLDQITIQIISSYVEDKSLYVATVVSQNGNPIENPNFVTRWYLEDINFNRVFLEEKTENCLYGCSIALSPDLQTGDYHIIVELVNIETERPIANGSTTLSINTNSQNSPLELVDSQAICEYEEWETEYSCKDGYACYNLFYSSNDTSCQPETRIVEGKHFRCAAEARCDNPEGIANSPTTPDQSCQPNNWKDETPYSCENGWACYNRWKITGGNSCAPEPDYGDDGNWFVCIEDSNCGTSTPSGAE